MRAQQMARWAIIASLGQGKTAVTLLQGNLIRLDMVSGRQQRSQCFVKLVMYDGFGLWGEMRPNPISYVSSGS